MTDRKQTAYYECPLPVFKQGDDLAHHLEREEATADAFEAMAAQYDAAAAVCRRMVGLAREIPDLEVHADTHHIGINGPVERLDPLVEEGLLSRHELGDEDEDDGAELTPEEAFEEGVLERFAGEPPFRLEEAVEALADEMGISVPVDEAGVLVSGLVEEGELRILADGRYEVALEDDED